MNNITTMLFAPLAQRYEIKANYLRLILKSCHIVSYFNAKKSKPLRYISLAAFILHHSTMCD